MATVPLTAEQRSLAETHVHVAMKFARHLCRDRPHLIDEAESAALLVVTLCAQQFDPDREEAKFTTFLFRATKHEVSRLTSQSVGWAREDDPFPRLFVIDGATDRWDRIRSLTRALMRLPKARARFLRLRYGISTGNNPRPTVRPLSLRAAADVVGIKRTWAAKEEKAGINELRRLMIS